MYRTRRLTLHAHNDVSQCYLSVISSLFRIKHRFIETAVKLSKYLFTFVKTYFLQQARFFTLLFSIIRLRLGEYR